MHFGIREHGDRRTRRIRLSYRRPPAAPTINAHFAVCIKTNVFACRRFRNLRKIWQKSSAISQMPEEFFGQAQILLPWLYENLRLRALTVRDYLIKCQTMAMFASIRDIKDKEVWQSPLTRSHCSLTRGFMKWQDRDCLSLPEKKSVFVNCRLSLTTL